MKHKRNKKGDGNNSLFDLAVGIAMSDENEELEERIKTLTRELDEKNKIIENLSKGGGGGDDFSKTVLQKVNILEENNKKIQQLIQQMESFTPNKETLNTILDKIKELQQHQYKIDQSINELTQFKPLK